MTPPLLSLCIPTYQRSRYLESLLQSLEQQLVGFPYSYEIVIADNASTDRTGEVVGAYAERMPIRYLRNPKNIGGYANWRLVMSSGLGCYLVYLADDDGLLVPQLIEVIAKMEADPDLAVTYAPWLLFDLVDKKDLGQFYSLPHDIHIARGEHLRLLDETLRYGIFPEIAVARREAFRATLPLVNEHAFFYFVQSAEYLRNGSVLMHKDPFYVSITRYFADEPREQAGHDEAEVAWDRYRGGLEYLLASCASTLTTEERSGLHLRVQRLIAQRMAVAIRMRHQKQRGAIDTYYLAMRLRGMGYEQLLSVPMATLASNAMLEFLFTDAELYRGKRQMVCVGDWRPHEREYLSRCGTLPLKFVQSLDRNEPLADTLLFVRDEASELPGVDAIQMSQSNVFVLRERNLLAKFGL